MSVFAEQIAPFVEDAAARHGAHVIDLVVRGTPHKKIVEVYVDAEDGVTTDLCAHISREISRVVGPEGLMDAVQSLTVSSPGISRPLRFPWQYKKHMGRMLRLKVHSPAGIEELNGTLTAIGDDGISVLVAGGENARALPFTTIVEAVVKAPW